MITDVSMVLLYPEEKNILDETVILTKKNKAVTIRVGRKIIPIIPTYRQFFVKEK
jgi:hypothetical protein